MIEAGATLERSDGDMIPLEVAVLSHIPELIPPENESQKYHHCLHWDPGRLLHGSATCSAFSETVDIVSAAGFDINAEDEHGWTPLANAIHRFASISKNDKER